MTPVVEIHEGIHVVRDDLYPGGTKARFVRQLFEEYDELVYASPAEGGAQTALAVVAKEMNKRATIFVAKRAEPHARTLQAKALGAQVLQVPAPAYLTVVRARAKAYAERFGAHLLPFGLRMDLAIDTIAAAARSIDIEPDEVWSTAGSGVLTTALAQAFPFARRHCVQVGHALSAGEVAEAHIWKHRLRFEQRANQPREFPADPHYDAKAWEICRKKAEGRVVLFWNVAPLPAF